MSSLGQVCSWHVCLWDTHCVPVTSSCLSCPRGTTGWLVRHRESRPVVQVSSDADEHVQRNLGDSQGDVDSGPPSTPLPPAVPTAHLTIDPTLPTLPAGSFVFGASMPPSPSLSISQPSTTRRGRLGEAGGLRRGLVGTSPQTEWLNTGQIHYLAVWEVESSK